MAYSLEIIPVDGGGELLPALVSDARQLHGDRRYAGALALALACVAATSKRLWPGDKQDGLKFQNCYARYLGKVSFSADPKRNLPSIVYSYYRCALLHEGTIERGYSFVEDLGGSTYLSFSLDGTNVTVSSRLILVLLACVEGDSVNAPLFGRTLLQLKARADVAALRQRMVLRTPGQDALDRMVTVLNWIPLTPAEVMSATPEAVAQAFSAMLPGARDAIASAQSLERARTGLFGTPAGAASPAITPAGVAYLKEMAPHYELVPAPMDLASLRSCPTFMRTA